MAFEIKRGDRRPHFRVVLTEDGDPADLTGASAARIIMKTGATLKIDRAPMTFDADRTTGIVEYAWDADDTDTVGTYEVEVEIDWGGSEFETFPSTGYFTVQINQDLG